MSDAPASPGGGSHESGGDQSPRSNVREQDRFLPIANISRIMKRALPANGKIAKDAKETLQECVSEFISFVTSEASDKCQREKRKTINGDDLLWAMATLGFEDYIEPLKVYLTRYREMEGDTKGSAKGGEGSGKRDSMVGQAAQNVQLAHQGSFNQAMNYGNSPVTVNWSCFKMILTFAPSHPPVDSQQTTPYFHLIISYVPTLLNFHAPLWFFLGQHLMVPMQGPE